MKRIFNFIVMKPDELKDIVKTAVKTTGVLDCIILESAVEYLRELKKNTWDKERVEYIIKQLERIVDVKKKM